MSESITLIYKPDPTGELSGVERVFKVEMSISVTIMAEEFHAAQAIVKFAYKRSLMKDCVSLLHALHPRLSVQAAKMAIEYCVKEALQSC